MEQDYLKKSGEFHSLPCPRGILARPFNEAAKSTFCMNVSFIYTYCLSFI